MVKWIAIVGLLWLSGSVAGATLLDPTAPLGAGQTQDSLVKSKPKTSKLPVLNAIFSGRAESGAVLNQQFVALGGSVQGYRLAKLAQDYVVLIKAGRQFRIKLDKVSVKQPVQ